jgi:hypothetical protein
LCGVWNASELLQVQRLLKPPTLGANGHRGACWCRCEHRPQVCSDYWDDAGRQVFINGSTASAAATIWPPGRKLQVWPTQVSPGALNPGTVVLFAMPATCIYSMVLEPKAGVQHHISSPAAGSYNKQPLVDPAVASC